MRRVMNDFAGEKMKKCLPCDHSIRNRDGSFVQEQGMEEGSDSCLSSCDFSPFAPISHLLARRYR